MRTAAAACAALAEIKRQAFPPALFEVPAGFRKEEMGR